MLVRDSASTSVCLPILQRPMLRLQARAWPYCRLYSMQEQLKPTQEEPFEPVKQAQGTKGNRARDKKKVIQAYMCSLTPATFSPLGSAVYWGFNPAFHFVRCDAHRCDAIPFRRIPLHIA
jgi:hypothetical protein